MLSLDCPHLEEGKGKKRFSSDSEMPNAENTAHLNPKSPRRKWLKLALHCVEELLETVKCYHPSIV